MIYTKANQSSKSRHIRKEILLFMDTIRKTIENLSHSASYTLFVLYQLSSRLLYRLKVVNEIQKMFSDECRHEYLGSN